MDNENGTATAAATAAAPVVTTKVDEPKSVEITTTKTDDTPIETVKSTGEIVANLDDKSVEAAVKTTDELKAAVVTQNNATPNDVNKTTTTVTVNVTQTRVKIDSVGENDEVDKAHSIDEVVSTVSSIVSQAAVGAIEKVVASEQDVKKSESIEAATNSIDDIEMADADAIDDCEMKDVSSAKIEEEQPQTIVSTTTATGTTTSTTVELNNEVKNVEADSVNSTTSTTAVTEPAPASEPEPTPAPASTSAESVSNTATNEAEQKIDDVEKNISNLFNGGDDNVVESTNDGKSGDDLSTNENCSSVASTQSGSGVGGNDLLKNGTTDGTKQSQSHDTINDNNDLVSILAGSDSKTDDDDNISSSVNRSIDAKKSTTEANSPSKSAAEVKPIENKSPKAISPSKSTTAIQSNNVSHAINSSPSIQKQSSDSSAMDTEEGLGGKAARQEIVSSHSSTVDDNGDEKPSTTELSTSVTAEKNVQNINGLSNETSSGKQISPVKEKIVSSIEDSVNKQIDSSAITATPKASLAVTKPDTVFSVENSTFNVNICYDSFTSELIHFSVDNKKQDTTTTSSSKPSNSAAAATTTSPSSSTTLSSPTSEAIASTTNQLDKTQKEVKGTVALCTFIIDHFENLRAKLTNETIQKTPTATSGRRGKNANAEPSTPSSAAVSTSTGSKRKRGAAAIQESPSLNDSIDSEMAQPRSAKKAKKEPTTPKAASSAVVESDYPEKAVLARWVDKKFYAGRVIEQKPNKKYVVLFEDGAKKTLPEEHILFGKENILPLVNENVHALVGGDTYEPGNVQSSEVKEDGQVYYTVQCESTTVTVTSSDIYLEEEQAKVILSKHATNNPEPGFSGGLSTRKDRRNKRYS